MSDFSADSNSLFGDNDKESRLSEEQEKDRMSEKQFKTHVKENDALPPLLREVNGEAEVSF